MIFGLVKGWTLKFIFKFIYFFSRTKNASFSIINFKFLKYSKTFEESPPL